MRLGYLRCIRRFVRHFRRFVDAARRIQLTMPSIRFKITAPLGRTNGYELRTYVKHGSETRFIRALNNCVGGDRLDLIVNEKYMVDNDQEMTLLLEATKYGHLRIVKNLLRKCNVDVDAKGTVKHFGRITEGVSALWLAAASGYFEIVQVLVGNGATVDALTVTMSTPLRAASYLGRVDIVAYLLEHGANINASNIFSCTCLMIACYKGHVDVVQYLLMNGADVNRQSNWGATAMHFAVQANNIEIVKLLLAFNAQQIKNKQSLTPILVAAERTNYVMVNYLLFALNLTREEIIEAEELLAASYLDEQNTCYNKLGFYILLHSMELRFNKHPIIPKKVYKTVEAYDNRVECQSIEELLNIKDNSEALHYESLIIRERILGETNLDLLESIIYRGSVYADLQNYSSCFKLWNHAMKIAQINQISIYKDIIRFIQEFFQMIKANIIIKLSDLKNVLIKLIEDLKMNQERMLDPNSIYDRAEIEVEYYENVYSALGLIVATSTVLANKSNPEDPLIGDIMNIIVELIKFELKTKDGQTLLHLCLNHQTNLDYSLISEHCSFPNLLGMKLLIFCGANVNAVDINNNAPLHYIGKFINHRSYITHNSDDSYTKQMVLELLNAGAHTDFVNRDGECPHTGFLKTLFNLTSKIPLSLKCLSARVLKNQWPKESYYEELPQSLKEFTDFHGTGYLV